MTMLILALCKECFGGVLGLIQWIGLAVAVAYLIIMGIKFVQNGATNDQAEIKKNLLPFAIGLIIIISVNVILGVISGIATGGISGGSKPTGHNHHWVQNPGKPPYCDICGATDETGSYSSGATDCKHSYTPGNNRCLLCGKPKT